MSETVNQVRAFEVLTAEPVRKRRKPRLVAAALEPGANVSAIARSAEIDPSQLYGWRRAALSSGTVAPLADVPGGEVGFARVETAAYPVVEIVVGDMVVRARAEVGTDHLVKVLRAGRLA